MAGAHILPFGTHEILLPMGENHRINPFAATDTTQLKRPEFVYLLRHHKTATAMATIHPTLPANRYF